MNSKSTQQKELVHQTSPKPEKKISSAQRRNRKRTEKILPQDQKEKSEQNYHDLEVSHEKIIKHLFHNLKY